jgi:GNAT superfamily N-acetyltransferase
VFFSGFTVLFDDSHKVIGAAGFSISEDNVVSLSFVTVSKKHRSNGYSKLIIEEMFKFFNEYGVVKIINSSYSFTELDNYNETGEVRLKKNINSLMESYPNIELVESSRRHWVPDDIVMNRMNLNRA